jgi:hypothetical protein
MHPTPEEVPLPEEQRKHIFQCLVAVQDEAVSVSESRSRVAKQFGITSDDVRRIEREGIESQWPPLADPD